MPDKPGRLTKKEAERLTAHLKDTGFGPDVTYEVLWWLVDNGYRIERDDD